MSINNMSVGKQYSLTFIDGNTTSVIDLGDVQSIGITANKHLIKSEPYNDDPRFGYIPDGYAFKFSIIRTNANLENYQLAQEAVFRAGGNSIAGVLNETIVETDRTTSRYQYPGFVFHVDNVGDITRNAAVKMSAEGMASKKTQIA